MGTLTDAKVKTATPGKHDDGQGLRLVVSPTGARKWVVRYQVAGRRREKGLGAYPGVSLKQARDKAMHARSEAAQGRDPIDQAKIKPETPATIPSFTQAAAAFIRAHRRGWQNPKHARQWPSTLKRYVRPTMGHLPVDAIETEHVLAVLKPIWSSKTETASRVQGRIEAVLDYAAAHGWRDQTNPARWRGHLQRLLPSPARVKKQRHGGVVRHQPAMPYQHLPEFMVELRALTSISAKALEFCILTATRTNEVLQAEWSEVDFDSATWEIPAERMKARRPHRVPLSDPALAVLASLPRVEGNEYIFPGARHGRPLSNMAMLQVMRKMGHGVGGEKSDAVPHGFRSSFRDWAGEVATCPSTVAEAALSHVLGDKTEAAYARGDLFEKRRALMNEWADWCGRGAVDNVVAFKRRAVG